ncbi:MAG: putative multidrug resistance-associated protein [Streblomastix strix]|uniref:Putative multidrug resistance-associated protein n=1 Tax=Streblomastix strix TaxID=222440 RepID=A0A5J4WBF0_9EUKA|nr:MAG: putative multidrug resistance-associated protein [Streblomastix strix]
MEDDLLRQGLIQYLREECRQKDEQIGRLAQDIAVIKEIHHREIDLVVSECESVLEKKEHDIQILQAQHGELEGKIRFFEGTDEENNQLRTLLNQLAERQALQELNHRREVANIEDFVNKTRILLIHTYRDALQEIDNQKRAEVSASVGEEALIIAEQNEILKEELDHQQKGIESTYDRLLMMEKKLEKAEQERDIAEGLVKDLTKQAAGQLLEKGKQGFDENEEKQKIQKEEIRKSPSPSIGNRNTYISNYTRSKSKIAQRLFEEAELAREEELKQERQRIEDEMERLWQNRLHNKENALNGDNIDGEGQSNIQSTLDAESRQTEIESNSAEAQLLIHQLDRISQPLHQDSWGSKGKGTRKEKDLQTTQLQSTFGSNLLAKSHQITSTQPKIVKRTVPLIEPSVKVGKNQTYDSDSFKYRSDLNVASCNVAEFEEVWSKEMKKKSPSLLLAFGKLFWRRFFRCYFFRFIATILSFATTYMMRAILIWTNDPKGTVIQGIWLSVAYFLIYFLQSIFQARRNFELMINGHIMRSTVIAAVFRRSLSLSSDARQDLGSGKILNLVSTDASRLESTLDECEAFLEVPIQIILSTVSLLTFLDKSSLVGMVVLIVMSPLSFVISRSNMAMHKQRMAITDRRVKRTTEAIQGIKIVKMNAWEKPIKDSISDIRDQELKLMRKMTIWRTLTQFISQSSHILSVISIIIARFAQNLPFTQAQIFPAISVLNQLRQPIMNIPTLISSIIETKSVFDRFQSFLTSESLRGNGGIKARERIIGLKQAEEEKKIKEEREKRKQKQNKLTKRSVISYLQECWNIGKWGPRIHINKKGYIIDNDDDDDEDDIIQTVKKKNKSHQTGLKKLRFMEEGRLKFGYKKLQSDEEYENLFESDDDSSNNNNDDEYEDEDEDEDEYDDDGRIRDSDPLLERKQKKSGSNKNNELTDDIDLNKPALISNIVSLQNASFSWSKYAELQLDEDERESNERQLLFGKTQGSKENTG